MKVLNLYAGIGGNRKLWEDVEVTAVELDEGTAKVYADFFPDDTVIVADAHEYLINHFQEFDFVWTSPPCPTHSDIRRCGVHRGIFEAVYPEMSLYQEIILLKHFAKKSCKWVVENVDPYYDPLIVPVKVDRHMFWSNFPIGKYEAPKKPKSMDYMTLKDWETFYDVDLSDYKLKNKIKNLRNCVHPELGIHVFNAARNIITKSNSKQTELLFD